MEQINPQKYQPKKQSRYDLVAEIAKQLGKPIDQMLGLTRNWTHEGLDNIYRSSLALSKDKGLPFSQAWFWHYNEVRKNLK